MEHNSPLVVYRDADFTPTSVQKLQLQLGRVIVRLRKERQISQIDLANDAGITAKYLSDVENGKRNVSLSSLLRIADSLQMPLGRLITMAEEG